MGVCASKPSAPAAGKTGGARASSTTGRASMNHNKTIEQQRLGQMMRQQEAFRKEKQKADERLNNACDFTRGVREAKHEDAPLLALSKSTHFPLATLRKLVHIFDAISGSQVSDEFIDREELASAMGLRPTSALARTLFRLFDVTQSAKVNFRTWVISLSALSDRATLAEKIRFSFSLYDLNGDGTIDTDELRALLEAAVRDSVVLMDMTDADVRALCDATLAHVDADGNGKVDFAEYSAVVGASPKFFEAFSIDVDKLIDTITRRGSRLEMSPTATAAAASSAGLGSGSNVSADSSILDAKAVDARRKAFTDRKEQQYEEQMAALNSQPASPPPPAAIAPALIAAANAAQGQGHGRAGSLALPLSPSANSRALSGASGAAAAAAGGAHAGTNAGGLRSLPVSPVAAGGTRGSRAPSTPASPMNAPRAIGGGPVLAMSLSNATTNANANTVAVAGGSAGPAASPAVTTRGIGAFQQPPGSPAHSAAGRSLPHSASDTAAAAAAASTAGQTPLVVGDDLDDEELSARPAARPPAASMRISGRQALQAAAEMKAAGLERSLAWYLEHVVVKEQTVRAAAAAAAAAGASPAPSVTGADSTASANVSSRVSVSVSAAASTVPPALAVAVVSASSSVSALVSGAAADEPSSSAAATTTTRVIAVSSAASTAATGIAIVNNAAAPAVGDAPRSSLTLPSMTLLAPPTGLAAGPSGGSASGKPPLSPARPHGAPAAGAACGAIVPALSLSGPAAGSYATGSGGALASATSGSAGASPGVCVSASGNVSVAGWVGASGGATPVTPATPPVSVSLAGQSALVAPGVTVADAAAAAAACTGAVALTNLGKAFTLITAPLPLDAAAPLSRHILQQLQTLQQQQQQMAAPSFSRAGSLAPASPGSSARRRGSGSLLMLPQPLPHGTHLSFTAAPAATNIANSNSSSSDANPASATAAGTATVLSAPVPLQLPVGPHGTRATSASVDTRPALPRSGSGSSAGPGAVAGPHGTPGSQGGLHAAHGLHGGGGSGGAAVSAGDSGALPHSSSSTSLGLGYGANFGLAGPTASSPGMTPALSHLVPAGFLPVPGAAGAFAFAVDSVVFLTAAVGAGAAAAAAVATAMMLQFQASQLQQQQVVQLDGGGYIRYTPSPAPSGSPQLVAVASHGASLTPSPSASPAPGAQCGSGVVGYGADAGPPLSPARSARSVGGGHMSAGAFTTPVLPAAPDFASATSAAPAGSKTGTPATCPQPTAATGPHNVRNDRAASAAVPAPTGAGLGLGLGSAASTPATRQPGAAPTAASRPRLEVDTRSLLTRSGGSDDDDDDGKEDGVSPVEPLATDRSGDRASDDDPRDHADNNGVATMDVNGGGMELETLPMPEVFSFSAGEAVFIKPPFAIKDTPQRFPRLHPETGLACGACQGTTTADCACGAGNGSGAVGEISIDFSGAGPSANAAALCAAGSGVANRDMLSSGDFDNSDSNATAAAAVAEWVAQGGALESSLSGWPSSASLQGASASFMYDLPAFPDDFYECVDEVVVIDNVDDLDIDDENEGEEAEFLEALKGGAKGRAAAALARIG